MAQHLVTAALIIGTTTCNVLANLALKVGAQRPSAVAGWPFGAINMHLALGAASFALGFVFYVLLLRRLPLSLAQAIFSMQFVLVILAANLVLHESIGAGRWLGIALMAAGLLVVSLSPEAKPVVVAEQLID